jgi:hypothetical protein
MSGDLYFINSYKRNKHHAYRLKKNLIRVGVKSKNIKIVYGYDLKKPETYKEKYKNLSGSKLVFHNFFDFIFPKIVKSGKNCYYLEDHTEVFDNPEKYKKNNKMVWLGFMKILSDYIVGAHLVFLHKDLIKEMNEEKHTYRPSYIDRLFKNIGDKKGYLQIDKSITQIVEHYSLALNKTRKNPKNKHFIFYNKKKTQKN